jgi:hypothetical protein
MPRGNRLHNPASPPARRPQFSCTARAISYVGECLARGASLLFLISAAAFSVMSPEPLGVRAFSFVLMGLMPALVAYSAPCLVLLMMRWGRRIMEPVAAVLGAVAWRACNLALTALSRITYQLLIQIVWAGKRAEQRLGLVWRRVKARKSAALNCAHDGQDAAVWVLCAAHWYARVPNRHFVVGVTFPIRFSARLLLKLATPRSDLTSEEPRMVKKLTL